MPQPLQVAYIDEPNCIGCARCLKVCPTDAIVGAAKFMHTVIAEDCTGCDKCLPVCPTDCISLLPRPATDLPSSQLAARWRQRIQNRKQRLSLNKQAREALLRRVAAKNRQ